MSFHTLLFWAFLAAIVGCFYATGKRRQWSLAVANAVFYGFAGLPHLLLFIGVSGLTYWCSRRHHRAWLWLGITVNLLNLGFFKYFGFAVSSVERLFRLPQLLAADSWALQIALPIGISFYTFQMISYLVDVLRSQLEPSRSWLEFWIYVSFFAQLIAGPIMRGRELLSQVATVDSIRWDALRGETGLMLVLIGLGKKLILADTLAPLVERLFSAGLDLTSAQAWLAAYLFGFQIYYDFSAYSDIALGIGRLLGIRLVRNFDAPYLSTSPREFWRRWHITLSNWIRDYLYIPLGGSRRGFVRSCAALLIAMALSGLWHGAAWTFAGWGIYHGLLVVGHRIWSRVLKPSRWSRPLAIAITFNLVTLGWVLFRSPDMAVAAGMMRKMVFWSAPGLLSQAAVYGALLGLLFGMHILEWWGYVKWRRLYQVWRRLPAAVRGVVWAGAILTLLAFTRPEASTFIYFRF